MTFIEKLRERQRAVDSMVCIGLDSDWEKIPPSLQAEYFLPLEPLLSAIALKYNNISYLERVCGTIGVFNNEIVKHTHPYVCAYKPNIAFYEALGAGGVAVLRRTIEFIQFYHPDIPIIGDLKRADIGNTNKGYVNLAFDYLQVDAVTVNPYFGGEALKPFLERKDKGIIVLCRTSNKGAGEFQDLPIAIEGVARPLYQWVAHNVAAHWNENKNCLLVVGATAPEELGAVRDIVGDMPILVPGVGAQGGDLRGVLECGLDSEGYGLIINSSRDIIYASPNEDFAEAAGLAAKNLRDKINRIKSEILAERGNG